MSEVLEETPADLHANLLETADYWLSLGVALALHDPDRGRRLLHLIEHHEAERGELQRDAAAMVDEVFD